MNMPRMPAMLGSQHSSMLPIGPRDISMLLPGSLVLCWISDRYYAVILAVVASPMGSSQLTWPDSLVAAGHAGIFADQAHQIVTTKETAHGFLDFSAGAPIDGLPGDWGHTNELGMAVFIGRLMASIRAGELCKLEMHYTDMLARLYAYNWQQYTAGSEDESFNDEGEWTRIRSYSPYPWESAGVNNKLYPIFDKKDELDPKVSLDRIGIEPVDQLQAPFVRYKEFEGFLGDLKRRFVVMPNFSGTGELNSRRVFGRTKSDTAQHKGLMEEVIGMDGAYLLRSAKSIGFEKTVWIPVPEELYPRDNPKGDHDFKDAAGEGMDFAEYPAQATPWQAVARLRDAQAHDLNKRRSEPLNQRDKDWAIRDDTEAEKGKIEVPGNFTKEIPGLTPYSSYEQPLPKSESVTIAPAGGRKSRYYQSKAFFGFLSDGSFLVRTGDGSELRMVGGNIELTCPGDVVMRSGRNVQTWAGKDVVIKGRENLEMTASTGNAWLKAEHNLELLGGNDGKTGGVLIESRGNGAPDFTLPAGESQIGGLLLKSARGQIGMWGNSLYMRSTSGSITMDSQGGNGNFVVYCGQLTKYLSVGSREVVATGKYETGDKQTYVVENTGLTFNVYAGAMTLGVNDVSVVSSGGTDSLARLTVTGSVTSGGTVTGAGDFNKNGQQGNYLLTNERAKAQDGKVTANKGMIKGFNDTITGAGTNGNPAMYGMIGFSYRRDGVLSLGDMVIYEAEWQKRFRQTAGIKSDGKYTAVWEEPDVSSRVVPDTLVDDPYRKTKPFPGKAAWDNGNGAKYAQADDQFYVSDATGGNPLPRGEKGVAYKTIKPPTISEAGFKDRYPINKM
jgi:hypothetical protein